jgi:hypothetical protein
VLKSDAAQHRVIHGRDRIWSWRSATMKLARAPVDHVVANTLCASVSPTRLQLNVADWQGLAVKFVVQ